MQPHQAAHIFVPSVAKTLTASHQRQSPICHGPTDRFKSVNGIPNVVDQVISRTNQLASGFW